MTAAAVQLRDRPQSQRVPPHNLQAEESLLGAMLLSREAIADAVEICDATDFYKPAHSHVFEAITSLYGRSEPVDLVTVAEEMRHGNVLDAAGGPALLLTLQGSTPATSNAGRYARIVRERAELRRLVAIGGEIAELGYSLPDDVGEAVAKATEMLGVLRASARAEQVDESLHPVDLEAVLDGSARQPVPDYLVRSDGVSLMYGGAINGIHGQSGEGKGWVLCALVAENARRGRRTMLLDFEDTAASVTGRLTALGMEPHQILTFLQYVRPQVALDAPAVAHLVELVTMSNVATVVVDSLGEAFALEGIDENHDVEVGPWFRRVARPLADAGAAVVVVDHSTKAADNPLHPSGSKRKRAAITGASYLVEAVKPLVKGEGGRLRLTCAKDRHGTHRARQAVGDLVMAAESEERLSLRLYAPPSSAAGDVEVPTILAARSAVAAAKEWDQPLSLTALEGLMTIRASARVKRGGIDYAASVGALAEEPGARNSRMFTYARDLQDEPDV